MNNTPNIREVACVIRHKAHLSFYNGVTSGNEYTCIYCKANGYAMMEAGEPLVVVWTVLKQVGYVKDSAKVGPRNVEYLGCDGPRSTYEVIL